MVIAIPSPQGQYNTNLGYRAGESTTTGAKNVMVGERAGETNNGSGNIFIGSYAGHSDTTSNTLIIANDSTRHTIYGDLSKQRVAIATTDFPSDTTYRLTVEGKVMAREFKATQIFPWPDYVFDEAYTLMPLDDLSEFINQHKHLPEISPAAEMESNGVELASLNMILLKKIEELTLYLIDQHQTIAVQSDEIESLQKQLVSLEKLVHPSSR
jgi:hypothetical protein